MNTLIRANLMIFAALIMQFALNNTGAFAFNKKESSDNRTVKVNAVEVMQFFSPKKYKFIDIGVVDTYAFKRGKDTGLVDVSANYKNREGLNKVCEMLSKCQWLIAPDISPNWLKENNFELENYIDIGEGRHITDIESADTSDGIVLVAGIVAHMTGLEVKSDFVLTGSIDEILEQKEKYNLYSSSGYKISPVGGVLEKVRAAALKKYKNFVLPGENHKDTLDGLESYIKVHYIETIGDLLITVFDLPKSKRQLIKVISSEKLNNSDINALFTALERVPDNQRLDAWEAISPRRRQRIIEELLIDGTLVDKLKLFPSVENFWKKLDTPAKKELVPFIFKIKSIGSILDIFNINDHAKGKYSEILGKRLGELEQDQIARIVDNLAEDIDRGKIGRADWLKKALSFDRQERIRSNSSSQAASSKQEI